MNKLKALDNLTLNIPSTYQENIRQNAFIKGKVANTGYDTDFLDTVFAAGNAVGRKALGIDSLRAWATGTSTTGYDYKTKQIDIKDPDDPSRTIPILKNVIEPVTTTLTSEERGKELAGALLLGGTALGAFSKVLGKRASAENLAYREQVSTEAGRVVSRADINRNQINPTSRAAKVITDPQVAVKNLLDSPNVPRLELLDDAEPGAPAKPWAPPVEYDPQNLVLDILGQRGELEGFRKEIIRDMSRAEVEKIASKKRYQEGANHEILVNWVEDGNMAPEVIEHYANRTGLSYADTTKALGRALDLHAERFGQTGLAYQFESAWKMALEYDKLQKDPSNRAALRRIYDLQYSDKAPYKSLSAWGKLARTFEEFNLRSRILPVTKLQTAARNASVQSITSLVHSLDTVAADFLDKTINGDNALPHLTEQSYGRTALYALDSILEVGKATYNRTTKGAPLVDGFDTLLRDIPRTRASLNGTDVYDIVTSRMYDGFAKMADAHIWTKEGRANNKAAFAQFKEDINPLTNRGYEEGGLVRGLTGSVFTLTDNVASMLSVFNRGQEAIFQNAHFKTRMSENLRAMGYKDIEGTSAVEQFRQNFLDLSDQVAAQKSALKNLSGDEFTTAKGALKDLQSQYNSHAEMITDAYLTAKKLTFAYEPGAGVFGHTILNVMRHPLLTATVNPYPRFMINSLTWLTEHNPVNFLDFFDSSLRDQMSSKDVILHREATHVFGKALSGAVMFAGAYAFQGSKYAGPTYNIVLDPDNRDPKTFEANKLDLSAYNPLDSFMLLGKAAKSAVDNTPSNIKISDILEAITNIKRLTDVPIFSLPEVVKELEAARTDPDALFDGAKTAKKLIGGWVSRFAVPVDYLRQIDGVYRQMDAVIHGQEFKPTTKDAQKDLSDNPLTGQTVRATGKGLVRVNPFTGKPEYPVNPTAEGVTGIKITKMSPVEEYIQQLGINSHQYLPRFSDARAMQEFNRAFGERLNTPVGPAR